MRILTIYVDESNFEFVTDSVNYEVLNDGLQVTGTGPKPVSHKYSYSGANTLLGYSTSSSAVSPDTNFSVGDTGTIALSNNTIHLYSVQQEPVDITISYAGSQIATMNSSGTKTLLTSGKYCEDDIKINYIKPTPNLQSKTASPTTSSRTITADSGFDGLSQVTVNAISPTKSSQTYTPTTTDQTIQSGRWLTGTQTIKGDANLVASNIKKDVQIFGVTGSYEGSGGGGAASFIQNHGTMTSYEDSTVTAIGQGAFAYCSSLANVSFSVCTSIGSSAFYYCGSLTAASFPSCTSIGSYAFYYCNRLTAVSFPACTTIGSYAFAYGSSLQTVSFPVCTNIRSSAFYYCTSLQTLSFPSCTSIGENAFTSCRYLRTASFPACTSIGRYAFSNCASLTTVNFPVCTSIGSFAFYNCYSLSAASFPACTTIGSYAFAYGSYLQTVSFPSCTSIGENAFYYCYNLSTASFPVCIKISASALARCFKLVSLYLLGSSLVPLANSNAFLSTPIAGYTTSTGGVYGSIYVPSSLLASYQSATNWTYFSNRLVGV